MNVQGPTIHFAFDPAEYLALCQLAQKLHTDVGSVLRIGGQLALEADRRGLLKMRDPGETARAVLSKGDA